MALNAMCDTRFLRDTPPTPFAFHLLSGQGSEFKAGQHSPGCRQTWQWATFFTTPSDTPAFSSFHWMNLRWSEEGYKCTKTELYSLFMWEKVYRQKRKRCSSAIKRQEPGCVSYLCRSVCPFSVWISLRACSLPTPGMPLWTKDNVQLT